MHKNRKGLRQGCDFSLDLLKLYSEVIRKELEVLSGFFIGGHNLNNVRYVDRVLIEDIEKKLEALLEKVLKGNKKKALNIKCKKLKYIGFSKKYIPRCGLRIGDGKMKQVRKFTYLEIELASQ